MLIKRRCFFGIGLEHTNLVHGDSNLISSNWCCNLDRGWLFDFWHYAMHHHPLLQLAQVAAPAPIPTTFVLSPRWHRLLDFSSFSCVTLLATVLLLFYGNLASHKLNAALGLKVHFRASTMSSHNTSSYQMITIDSHVLSHTGN